MFSADDDQVVPTTTKAQPAETPKLESEAIEKQSGGIDFG
jgi:hypothetical protein